MTQKLKLFGSHCWSTQTNRLEFVLENFGLRNEAKKNLPNLLEWTEVAVRILNCESRVGLFQYFHYGGFCSCLGAKLQNNGRSDFRQLIRCFISNWIVVTSRKSVTYGFPKHRFVGYASSIEHSTATTTASQCPRQDRATNLCHGCYYWCCCD